jgi:hypothetical protein
MAALEARNGTDPALAALDGAGLDGAGPDGAGADRVAEAAGVSAPF